MRLERQKFGNSHLISWDDHGSELQLGTGQVILPEVATNLNVSSHNECTYIEKHSSQKKWKTSVLLHWTLLHTSPKHKQHLPGTPKDVAVNDKCLNRPLYVLGIWSITELATCCGIELTVVATEFNSSTVSRKDGEFSRPLLLKTSCNDFERRMFNH